MKRMKIDVKEATVESSGSFGKKVQMGISEEGVANLMFLLSNLYNDPELAAIREYTTNALDAHIRVGQTRPVDIYLPSRDNPLFVVKDYGVGMSFDDIEFIYSQYGKSTKSASNDEAGAFGLGAKAALAIATQFSLTSVKDGQKTTALISKTETGINDIDILPSKPTDEGNGTTITIPVPHVSSFLEKVSEFFKYSDPNKVLINGHKPDSVLANATKVDVGIAGVEVYTESNSSYYRDPKFRVIMGNVPYAMTPDEVTESIKRTGEDFDISYVNMSLYISVGIGDVDLTPSREGLRYTDKTNARVDAILKAYIKSVRKQAVAEVEAVDKREDVFAVLNKWAKVLPKGYKQWRGEEVPDHVSLPPETPFVSRYGKDSEHKKSNNVTSKGGFTIVYGRDVAEYRKVAAYLTPYLEHEGQYSGHFIFVTNKSDITSKWITENGGFTFIEAEKLVEIGKAKRKADRLAAKANKPPVEKFPYPVIDLVTKTAKMVPYNEIPEGTPYLSISDFSYTLGGFFSKYFNGTEPGNYYNQKKEAELATALSHFTSAKQVVIFGGNRKLSALQDRVKGTYSIVNDFSKAVNDIFQNVHMDVRNLASLEKTELNHILERAKKLDMHANINDRDLRRLINPTKKAKRTYDKLKNYETMLEKVRPDNKRAAMPRQSTKITELVNKYPLISAVSVYQIRPTHVEHLIKYMNAVHDESLTPVA
jgi:hypothetical protein